MNGKPTCMELTNAGDRSNVPYATSLYFKKKCYGTNIIFIMPPRKRHLNNLENQCVDCYYYKQMKKFLSRFYDE